MLKELIKKDLCAFYDDASDWKDAIAKSCSKLIEKKIVSKDYINELVASVDKYGPYICIDEGIAMPHSTQGGVNVFETEIAFTKFEKEVEFDEENKSVLFFTLASVNPEKHIENMQKLMEVLGNDDLKEELFNVRNIDDIKRLSEKYDI
ncbi:PTS sugar transporter subunit IIA [Oceanivirga miroungae]|uniref:Ascorbate-specific PTS system EIIA component n=1 Tax=Oceanivirga miroungae TaxID=1130046 RepID=A0A6I8MA39_9FUSO|nr:PTS sugar transporter subunit IIA [Oceanivirga miroungae]VWL85690.1 PTS transporter subunit IIA-like nitrogen-regulatory protein PtsN [Oceanivirga miroungae]